MNYVIMKRTVMSTFPPKSTKTKNDQSLNTKETMSFADGNPGTGVGQGQKRGGVKLVNGTPLLITGSTKAIQIFCKYITQKIIGDNLCTFVSFIYILINDTQFFYLYLNKRYSFLLFIP